MSSQVQGRNRFCKDFSLHCCHYCHSTCLWNMRHILGSREFLNVVPVECLASGLVARRGFSQTSKMHVKTKLELHDPDVCEGFLDDTEVWGVDEQQGSTCSESWCALSVASKRLVGPLTHEEGRGGELLCDMDKLCMIYGPSRVIQSKSLVQI